MREQGGSAESKASAGNNARYRSSKTDWERTGQEMSSHAQQFLDPTSYDRGPQIQRMPNRKKCRVSAAGSPSKSEREERKEQGHEALLQDRKKP